jgi:hypothetical protein
MDNQTDSLWSKNKNCIVVNIDNISDAKSFEDGELIQREAKEHFKELLKSFIKDSKDSESSLKSNNQSSADSFEIARRHNAILIDGKRGTGKTSFALSMKHYISNNNNKDEFKIADLGILDPTLIETKEHIFIDIIMRIVEKVERTMNCENLKTCSDNFHADDKLLSWRKHLYKLANGLSLLDGVGSDKLKNEIWDSPELIIEEGLKNARSGEELERNFHCFIEESLKLLDKNAFMIFLDDIDTSVDKGVIILEILRKYLTSKKFIVVLLGDINLYSLLARQLQWKKIDLDGKLKDYENLDNTGNAVSNKECREYFHENIYIKFINNLQDQYLVKILKPQNRIFLKTINYYKDDICVEFNDLSVDKTTETKSIKESLDVFLKNRLIKNVFHTDYRDADVYEEYICSLTQRSFLQFLKLWDMFLKKNDIKNSLKSEQKKNISDFIFNLHSLFITYLQDMDSFNFTVFDGNLINRLSIYLLEGGKCFENMYNFLPAYISETYNAKAFFLNAVFANYLFEKKFKALEYFIKLGLVKKCYEESNGSNANEFIPHFKLNEVATSAVDISKIAAGYFQGSSMNPNELSFGYMHVSREDYERLYKIHGDKNNFIFFKLILSKNRYSNNYDYIYGSFFSILGLISDILCLKENNSSIDKFEKEIAEIFIKYSEIPVVKTPFAVTKPVKESSSDEATAIKDDSDYFADGSDTQKLIKATAKWANMSCRLEPIAIPYLHRIWERFASNIDNVTVEFQGKGVKLDKILHRYVISFLNAVLTETILNSVETKDDNEINKKFVIQNPVKDDSVFDGYFKNKNNYGIDFLDADKFKQGNDTKQINLFNYIFSCPIWGIYLNNIYEEKKDGDKMQLDSMPPSAKYYFELQSNFYESMNSADLLKEHYNNLNIHKITEPTIISKQKQLINFSSLSGAEQKKAITDALKTDNTDIKYVKPIIDDKKDTTKLDKLIKRVSDVLRYGFQEIKYTKIAKATVEKIIKEL